MSDAKPLCFVISPIGPDTFDIRQHTVIRLTDIIRSGFRKSTLSGPITSVLLRIAELLQDKRLTEGAEFFNLDP